MKKPLLLVVLSVLFSLSTRAQYVTIPDPVFATYLNTYIPTCMNGNQLDTTCPDIANLTYVDVPNQGITDLTGIQYLHSVKFFDCTGNPFDSLPPLPGSLTHLKCSNNFLTSLPVLPPGLVELLAEYNKLTFLPDLPASLTNLDCSENLLTTLPALPPSLRTLTCRMNNLNSLGTLPPALEVLYCSGNRVVDLVSLPATMKELYCDGNQLTALPALPDSLQQLICAFNYDLGTLPTLPSSLLKLDCKYNSIRSLPALPPTLNQLDCSFNLLSSLPALPAELDVFNIASNTDLKCMPPLKKFTGNANSFGIGGTGIRCLPNKIQYTGIIPVIDTMPICNLFNTNGCQVAWNIHGSLYRDDSTDCQWQGTEPKISTPVKMNLYQGSTLVQSIFSSNGTYSFDTDVATYKIEVDTANLPLAVSCKADTILTLTTLDSLKTNIDFGLHCKPGFDVGANSIFGNFFRPANTTLVKIAAGDMAQQYGLHCATGISGTVTLTITGPAQYAGQMPYAAIPSSVAGNVITWNVGDFAGWPFDSAFHILVRTDTFAQAGQQVCFTVSVTPTSGDYNPANNILTQCFEVRTSFDPNDKQVYPSGNTDTATKWLTYTVRFQNTGNDTAIHIYILDTLSTHFDVSSFQLLSSSHKNTTQVYGDGIVKFNFPNIMLPDSNVNEPLSHGYVQYKVRLKDNLPLGAQIENTAYIYFDFNTPVVTNTTLNTLTAEVVTGGVPLSLGEGPGVRIYPNPSTNTVFITTSGFIPGWVSIYDINGRRLSEQRYTQQIDISSLTGGVYLVEVRNQASSVRNRLVKM